MKIVFMGTPKFALKILKTLFESEHKILAIITKEDKPYGRKKILISPVVKIFATENNIKVLQPNSIRTEDIHKTLLKLNPDVIIVAAYGKIVPPNILNLPKYGCINVHASLLPKYRGAAPIAWSIVNGEKETGITIMQMDENLDTGDILSQEKTNIFENETAEDLCNRLAKIGASLLMKTLNELLKGNIKKRKQNEKKATFAPIIKKEFSLINWSKTSEEIHNLTRGFSPWPCARTTLNGKILKILKTKRNSKKSTLDPGCVESLNPLLVACGNNECLEILKLQLEGKKSMSFESFVIGNFKKKNIFGT